MIPLRYLLLGLSLAITAQAGQMIAYSKGNFLYVAQIDGSKPKKLAPGSWPAISPDGTFVAYNTDDEKTTDRHIAIVDLSTGRKTIFGKEIPSDNCYGPVWSPDGKQLAFYLFSGNDWDLGLINADGTGFRYVKKAGPNNNAFWSAAWAADGKSFFCQDMQNLYRIDLQGKVLKQWSLAKLLPGGDLSSGSHFAPSPDGRIVLIDVDMDADITRPEWDGPPPAIWQFDPISGTATQGTKTSLFAWYASWVNDHEILCNHLPEGSKTISTYRLTIGTAAEPKLVVKSASDASASR